MHEPRDFERVTDATKKGGAGRVENGIGGVRV